MRVVVLDDTQDVFRASPHTARLRERVEVTIYTDRAGNEDELLWRIAGAQAIVANRERSPLPRTVLERASDLELIAQTGTGMPHLDVAAATDLGILVCNTPGGSLESVVELTFGLIFAALRRIPANDAAVRRGEWPATVTTQLSGKTMGLLGLGAIGAETARVARAFKVHLFSASPTLTPERAAQHGCEFTTLDDLLQRSDVVSIHLRPVPGKTVGLIGARELALMKPGALLVNTARGSIVQENALVEALRDGRIFAALDVFDVEPLPADHPLRQLDNVVLAPHVGGFTDGAYDNFIGKSVDNILAYLDGRPRNAVNPDAIARRSVAR